MKRKLLSLLFLFVLFQPYIVFSQEEEPLVSEEPAPAVPAEEAPIASEDSPPAPEEAVSKATTCTCVIEISGTGCNINQEFKLEIDKDVSAQDIIDQVSLLSCPFKLLAGNFVNTQTKITVTEDVCRSAGAFPSGSQEGYSYGLTCSLSDERPSSSGSNTVSGEGNGPQTPPRKVPPPVRLVNPIGGKYNEDYTKQSSADSQGNSDIQIIIGNAIQVTLRLLGAITLAVFFYGGFMWLTSAGNSEKVSTGTKTMMYATIGLFIIFGAYGILTTIISGITSGKATPGGGGGAGGTGNSVIDAQNQKELRCAEQSEVCLKTKSYDTCIAELTECNK